MKWNTETCKSKDKESFFLWLAWSKEKVVFSLFQLHSFFPRITRGFFSRSPLFHCSESLNHYTCHYSAPIRRKSQVKCLSIYARIKKAKEKHLAFFYSWSWWWWRRCTSYFLNLLSKSFKKKPSVTYTFYPCIIIQLNMSGRRDIIQIEMIWWGKREKKKEGKNEDEKISSHFVELYDILAVSYGTALHTDK